MYAVASPRLPVSFTLSKRRHTKDAEVARMAVEDCSKYDGEVDYVVSSVLLFYITTKRHNGD
jgi:hypothetical protein